MEQHRSFSRRKFIEAGGILLTGAALGLPAIARAAAPSATVRIGLIGSGARGTGLATLLKQVPGVELAACCDPIPAHLANGMKEAAHNARSYNNYKALLENKDIDAMIIATPLFTHFEIACAALNAGKHVYLEKSMAYDITQSVALLKKVRSSKQVFQVGFQYRYYDLYKRVKQAIDEQWLGTITGFECQYHQNSNWRRPNNDPKMERAINWRMYREYSGGPLSELCAHQIDMIHYILGTHPVSVVGSGSINFWKDGRETYDSIRTIYEYPNGVQASVSSMLSNAYRDYNIRILGTRATIDISRTKALIYPEARTIKRETVDGVTNATVKAPVAGEELIYRKPGEANPEPTIYSLTDFADCIRNGKKPASNAETAHLASVAIIMGNTAADTHQQQVWKPEYNS